jgi:DNA-damage-inducible protein D
MEKNIFEKIKKVNEYGAEYWSARELMGALGYKQWKNFEIVVSRAIIACKGSFQKVEDHFAGVSKMIKIAKGTIKEADRGIDDVLLSRYACYLIAQNGDSRKKEIALAQTYFAVQTHRQEISEKMIEDNKRVILRAEMKRHNKKLAQTATVAGVQNYGTFTNYGYLGLYGGLGQKDIHNRKGLKRNEKILDFMGSEELAANLFRATQTEAKLRRENIKGEDNANNTHFQVGRKVRQTIEDLGGTMPENLPVADNINKAKKRLKDK